MHHAYKHGRYSKLSVGILRRAGDALEAVQILSTLHEELAVHKALILHKLEEIHASGPSDQTWIELGASMDAVDRLRAAGDRQGVAEELTQQREFVRSQRSSAIARREVCALIDTHSKIVDRESRRQERAAATVSVNAVFGFVELLTKQVVVHVSDPAERKAVASAFNDAVRRAGRADRVHDEDAGPGLCWAWRARQKARGQRLEEAGDQAGADACRCHRRARAQTGRCRRHGGTAVRGPMHHAYKHGRYSTLSVGILPRAGDALAAVQHLSMLYDELVVRKTLIDHILGEITQAGPSDQAWVELGASMDAVDRLRAAGDRQGVAAALTRQRALVRSQRAGAIARRDASALIDTHSTLVRREARRPERAAATVSVNAFFGFVEMLTHQVNLHVTDPADGRRSRRASVRP